MGGWKKNIMKKIIQYGRICYCENNHRIHRQNGPAEIHFDGTIIWRKDGLWHRENKPASFYTDDIAFYWINDRSVEKK
jgi:hypothetical protein